MSVEEDFKKRNFRALSKAITLAENADPSVCELLAKLYSKTGKARIIGMTGPPGAGKSTLTSHFVKLIRAQNKTVAVVAVDPMSPFTGGALLGDRIRLVDHFNDENVFIRSLSTRGKLGGLSLASREVIHLVDAFGFDYIILETVGVGQSEVDIRNIADVTLVALVPEAGDSIQTIKAGLLEIADIFVVHKSDRQGADKLANSLKEMIHFGTNEISVLLSTIKDEASIKGVFDAANNFISKNEKLIAKRRQSAVQATITELLERQVLSAARQWVKDHVSDHSNPYQFMLNFLVDHPPSGLFKK